MVRSRNLFSLFMRESFLKYFLTNIIARDQTVKVVTDL